MNGFDTMLLSVLVAFLILLSRERDELAWELPATQTGSISKYTDPEADVLSLDHLIACCSIQSSLSKRSLVFQSNSGVVLTWSLRHGEKYLEGRGSVYCKSHQASGIFHSATFVLSLPKGIQKKRGGAWHPPCICFCWSRNFLAQIIGKK